MIFNFLTQLKNREATMINEQLKVEIIMNIRKHRIKILTVTARKLWLLTIVPTRVLGSRCQ